MKRGYKKLLSVLGAICLVVPFIGCEADAEEAQENATEGTNSPIAVVGADVHSPVDGGASTNAVVSEAEAGETNVSQTVVIQPIPPTVPAGLNLTKGVEEVVKLTQSGVSETVILLFVEKSTEPFELDAADIVYLNDIGISPTVLAAMLNHDGAETDVLHDALSTNNVVTATAPPNQVTDVPSVSQAVPPVEVSSNYVAAPQGQYGGSVVSDPNMQAQQQVVVEQQPVVAQQPAVVVTQPAVTYSYFYNSLSPYGSWVYVADYGWAWQPTIAVTHRGWRPYLHGGRWLHSDVGWYWHSDYSWGWAPFHYGRWHSSPRFGWVWTPDYTWGPSWVTWRRSRDYCGWAPLPPRAYVRPGFGFSYWGREVGFNFSFGYSHDYYTFVPSRRFCDRRMVDHVVATDRSVNIYKDSTVVNNYIVGNNNTIINNGVGRDYVASHTRGEIPRVRVQESSAANGRVVPDRLVRQGAETVVYRPQRPAPSLVAAHETAVARTRGEIARPTSTDSLATRRNMINSRQGTSEALAPGARPTSPRGGNGSTAVTRTETARPQIARGEVPTPVFAKPAPVRPEPDRSAEILRSRTSQESRVVRPSTGTGTIVRGGGTVSAPTSTPTARPVTAPSRSGVPRFEQSQPQTGGGVVRPTTPQTSGRPGTPSRSEIGRGSPVPGTPTPVPSTRPSAAPRTATPVAPAQGGESAVQPVRPRNESGRPVTVLPSGRSGLAESRGFSQSAPNASVTAPQVARPSQPVAQSPAFARPAPTVVQQPAGPIVRPSVTTSTPSTVSPGASGPAWSRQSAIQRDNVSAAPQTIQRVAPPAQSPSLARPHTVQRSESFSRPSMPVQPAARPNVVQPQTVTPIQRPAMVRPQMSNPTVSAPVRNAPSVRTSPGPVQGGGYRSAPPSTPAARPVSPSSGRDSRGRIEIGR